MTTTSERERQLRQLAADQSRLLSGFGGPPTSHEPGDAGVDRLLGAGLHTLESLHARGLLTDAASQRLELLIRRDRFGSVAEYVAATGSSDYERAFQKIVQSPDTAKFTLTERERAAVDRVTGIRAALNIDTGAGGVGFVVPVTIDPAVIATSEGAINPWRAVAKTATIAGNIWRGITSDGVEATYEAELTEVDDSTPTFVGPEARVEKAQAWVEFSIEVGMDWPALVDELRKMFVDARDLLEADKFTNGAGHASHEPEGIIAALPSESIITTINHDVISPEDVYELKAELPPRFQPGGSWLGHGATFDVVRRLAGPGSDEPALWTDDGRILRKPAAELSALPAPSIGAYTPGDRVLALGDFQQAAIIVDRIGAVVELVQLVMGPNGRPKGSRGAYMYWRSTSKLLAPEAVRCLRIGATDIS